MGGNFAVGEDTHALRLTSKLVDLRAGYTNPICSLALAEMGLRTDNKKASAQWADAFLAPATGIEPITTP